MNTSILDSNLIVEVTYFNKVSSMSHKETMSLMGLSAIKKASVGGRLQFMILSVKPVIKYDDVFTLGKYKICLGGAGGIMHLSIQGLEGGNHLYLAFSNSKDGVKASESAYHMAVGMILNRYIGEEVITDEELSVALKVLEGTISLINMGTV